MSETTSTANDRENPTWELVWRRNSIERLKHERFPTEILDDLPRLIATPYEAISEEDIVRLQWYGLYHDKPKVGTFMLRVKLPGGQLTPHKLRTLGRIVQTIGREYAELSTRQNVQIHWLRLADLPEVFATLEAAGMSTRGGCGDTVRNITACPVAGLEPGEAFDVRPIVEEAASFFYGNREYSDLPRKHKITIAACPHQCNAPEMHCIALIGLIQDGVPGFAVRIGGGLSGWPRLSEDIGAFVPADEALVVLRAIIDVWKSTLKYRLSRAKARLKFMVDDIGGAAYRAQVEERLGRKLLDLREAPQPIGETDHIGVHPQKQPGRSYIGFPVFGGTATGTQMVQLADLAESFGGEIRLTRQQNFILTDVPNERVEEVVARVAEIGFPLAVNRIRATSLGCTGQPLCNYAVAETKGPMRAIVRHLEERFGEQVSGLKIHVDGCPHACAHHWTGDIGLQGTTARERAADGSKIEAYEIYLRGGYGRDAAIGRPVLRRVPASEAPLYVERLVRAWLEERRDGESIRDYFRRKSDEELVAIASGGEAPAEDGAARPRASGLESMLRRTAH